MATKREIDYVIEEYGDLLMRIAMLHVSHYAQAQDIVQDAFIKYIYKAPEFRDHKHEKAWLIRVTTNLCKDYLKHWRNNKRIELSEEYVIPSIDDNYQLLEIVKQLPFHHRNAVYLYYYEKMSIKEIAEVFHVKESTVSSWLFRSRKRLKKLLEGEWENEER